MDKTYTYEEYEKIADDYFQGEFTKQVPFDEQKSLTLFRQVLKDYLEKKIDIKVVGLIASDLYWYLNDTSTIERNWSNKFSSALLRYSEAHYYSRRAQEGSEKARSRLQEIVEDIEQNWEMEIK